MSWHLGICRSAAVSLNLLPQCGQSMRLGSGADAMGAPPKAVTAACNIHSFIHSFLRWFIRSFVHSFSHSFIHSFIHPSIHSFIPLFVLQFVHSLQAESSMLPAHHHHDSLYCIWTRQDSASGCSNSHDCWYADCQSRTSPMELLRTDKDRYQHLYQLDNNAKAH